MSIDISTQAIFILVRIVAMVFAIISL